LVPQLLPEDEILLVDQNIPPLAPPPALASLPLRILPLQPPSLTRARNLGLRRARNDGVIFLDDDIVPRGNLLEAFARAARANPRCILTGTVEQDEKPEGLEGVGFADLRSGEIRTDYTRPVRGEIPFFPGGLFLVRRSDLPPGLEFCGGFRGASQGEEIDFALRAKRAGLRVVSDPDVGMRHLKSPAGGCRSGAFLRRFFLDEVYNRSLFYGRHGLWIHAGSFLRRLRGFCEFHTRRPGGKGHRPGLLALAAGTAIRGFMAGAALRLRR
jgi:GT2 family glycosyltransferase